MNCNSLLAAVVSSQSGSSVVVTAPPPEPDFTGRTNTCIIVRPVLKMLLYYIIKLKCLMLFGLCGREFHLLCKLANKFILVVVILQ